MSSGFAGKFAIVRTGSMWPERAVTAPSSTAYSTANAGGPAMNRRGVETRSGF